MKLSIIIVSWNVVDKLRDNLNSIFKSQTSAELEVFVVDNASSDGSADMVAAEFPQVRLIRNTENLGFAKANNQAIRLAHSEYILLLNPDMQVFLDTFENMINWSLANEQAWVIGCQLEREDGVVVRHVRRFPTLWDQALIILKIPHILPVVLDGYLRAEFDYSQAARVDSVRGGFFFLNLKHFRQLPLLDERYFLWFEEVDFCRQVKSAGGEVWYTPVARCIDHVGQSFGQLKRYRTQKYFRDSMLKYFLKWHGAIPFVVLFVLWAPMIAISWLIDLLNLKSRAQT